MAGAGSAGEHYAQQRPATVQRREVLGRRGWQFTVARPPKYSAGSGLQQRGALAARTLKPGTARATDSKCPACPIRR